MPVTGCPGSVVGGVTRSQVRPPSSVDCSVTRPGFGSAKYPRAHPCLASTNEMSWIQKSRSFRVLSTPTPTDAEALDDDSCGNGAGAPRVHDAASRAMARTQARRVGKASLPEG